MENKIRELIHELQNDVRELDAEIRAKNSKLSKLQVIVMQLQNILKEK